MLERQPGGFDDGLHVLQCLPRLAFDRGGKFSLRVAPPLAGNVEKVAGENPWTVGTDWFDTRRSNCSFLPSRSESAGEDRDRADEGETNAHDEHSPIHMRSSGQGRILSFFRERPGRILGTRLA